MARTFWALIFFIVALIPTGCSNDAPTQAKKPELLIYCGITMVNPIKKIAEILEPELGIDILITQGGSEDLYRSLKTSQKGDLYLPGSASYRKKHENEGLLGEWVHVGYNQATLIVAEGNPKHLDNQLTNLTRPDLRVIIGDPDSGSIGRETKRILEAAGIYDKVRSNVIFLSTDSRNLNYALKQNDADVSINWRATALFPENRDQIDHIDLSPEIAIPKKLVLNLLTFSQFPDEARRFMQYTASPEGQAIFRRHGFLDNQMQADTD